MKRATICIGVNRAGGMTPLSGARRGARDFCRWAETQGCDTTLLIDQGKLKVCVGDIFDVVERIVDAGTYDQLIIYFSGHGILKAPEAEYWLLSRAPQNPNEAVNLSGSIAEARNSAIPHVIFVSDACRSAAAERPLSGVMGGVIFPSSPVRPQSTEIDVFYATRPGDPAYEVAEAEATKAYKGIFTASLLSAVKSPNPEWVEAVDDGESKRSVVKSRHLKNHLEATVPYEAAAINIKLRQEPNVIVGTDLPKFFAVVDMKPTRRRRAAPPPSGTTEAALNALSATYLGAPVVRRRQDVAHAADLGLTADVERLAAKRGRISFETRTGFTLFGVKQARADARHWSADLFREPDDPEGLHVRLRPSGRHPWRQRSSIVLEVDRVIGTVLPVLPGFVGALVVEQGRVTSVNYVPSRGTPRYRQYERRAKELERMKAFAAVASRNGRFVLDELEAPVLAQRIRQFKGIDPTMGLYAAYAYAQVGRYEDVYSVYRYMRNDELELPVPFDVVMLAARFEPAVRKDSRARFAPFVPMLSQGWALLMPGDPMYQPIHQALWPHLIPSLWTTLDVGGVRIARRALGSGQVA